MRDAVEEIGRAVDRIDDPARLEGIARNVLAFFEHEAPVGPRVAQLVDQGRLRLAVGVGHEVGRPLAADLQLLDLAEVAANARCRLARGTLHDGDEAGMGDHDQSARRT